MTVDRSPARPEDVVRDGLAVPEALYASPKARGAFYEAAAALLAEREERERENARLKKQRDDAINGRNDLPMAEVLLVQLQAAEAERDTLREALREIVSLEEHASTNQSPGYYGALADCADIARVVLAAGMVAGA